MRLEVPAYRQEEPWSCLPACLRMALAYLGHSFTEEEIRLACGASPIGTSVDQAALGLRRLGLSLDRFNRPESDLLFEFIAAGSPVICSYLAGFSNRAVIRHAVLVCGADDDAIYFVDPFDGRETQLPPLAFCENWALGGGDALVVGELG